jgi:hypothetical protein
VGWWPLSCFCYFFLYAVAAHQLHRAGFIRPWHPRVCPFLFLFLNFISDPRPPVAVAFGHALPWGGGPCSFSCYFFVYAVAAYQLHRAGFVRMWGGGPSFLFFFSFHDYARSPPTASRRLYSPVVPPYASISLCLLLNFYCYYLISTPR